MSLATTWKVPDGFSLEDWNKLNQASVQRQRTLQEHRKESRRRYNRNYENLDERTVHAMRATEWYGILDLWKSVSDTGTRLTLNIHKLNKATKNEKKMIISLRDHQFGNLKEVRKLVRQNKKLTKGLEVEARYIDGLVSWAKKIEDLARAGNKKHNVEEVQIKTEEVQIKTEELA